MNVWMQTDGEVLYLNKGNKPLDLRNTSRERPILIDFNTGKGILLKNIVCGELTKSEYQTDEGKKLVEKGLAIYESEPKEVVTEKPVEAEQFEEPVEKNWDDMNWHEKKKFADDNNYEGKNYKEDTLDNWFKGFVKDNEV